MAANAGFNKTSQNDLVEGVDIAAIILGMNAQPRVYQDIAMINTAVTKPTWRIVRNDLITVNATLAEADEASFTSFTTSAAEITPAVYPVRSHVSLELMQDSAVDALSKAIADHAEVIMNAIDANVLANISSATNTTDHNGVALDKDKFEAALLAFKKQKPNPGPIVFVGGYKQIADVIGAYGNAGGSSFGVPGVVSSAVAAKQDSSVYYRGNVAGVDLFEAAVPASGGADVSGAFMVSQKALALGFWVLLDYKLTDPAGRVGVELMTWSRYGSGIASNANLREVISLA
jgi:hypothetical protein